MAIRRATKATVWVIAVASVVLAAGACGSSSQAVPPPPPTALTTTTITGNTPSQVVGWVTPTLNNGIAFVNGVPPGAPLAQLVRAAQTLSTACVASENELKETTWTGQALVAKTALNSSLAQTVALVAKPPPSGFAAALHAATDGVSQQLKALAAQVHS